MMKLELGETKISLLRYVVRWWCPYPFTFSPYCLYNISFCPVLLKHFFHHIHLFSSAYKYNIVN